MDRRKFLTTGSLAAISVSVFGEVVKVSDNKFEGDCKTTSDALGPFYRENAPVRNDLTFGGLEGSILNLKGIVYGKDCVTPLEDVSVEIWHCDTEGNYDNTSSEYKHRATTLTDEKGEYWFKTIFPGKYGNGTSYRPAHIHFLVRHKKHKKLISQIYFKGDPIISEDPASSSPLAENRILPIVLEDAKGNLSVTFNIYLSERLFAK